MAELLKSVVIVGGGAAGWLTAGILAAKLRTQHADAIQITLIESPDIPTVGVGEGTWPTMRLTLQRMGIDELDLLRHCDASFKQGTKFVDWVTAKGGRPYYHPFSRPVAAIAPAWVRQADTVDFAYAASPQAAVCDAHRAPKTRATASYAGNLNYGYHLDAGKFGILLQKHCTQTLGVTQILDTVTEIKAAPNGDIASVVTAEHGAIAGDLFIDCTGFRSLLLGAFMGVGLRSISDILPIDSALAVQMPYAKTDAPIASQTLSTAQSAGWIWDIGLTSRRGIGHVFSSAHISEDAAFGQLARYIKEAGGDMRALTPREIRFEPGYRDKFWEKNCVAVGLSAGFLEPLEASAMVLVEMSANMIAGQFPVTKSDMPRRARRFNKKFRYRWERIIDFLKLHYVLNQRHGEAFWDEHRQTETQPETLKDLLAHWRYYYPSAQDFDHADEMFPAESYEYVLFGMGFRTQKSHVTEDPHRQQLAYEKMREVPSVTKRLLNTLPDHRSLLNQLKTQNFSTPIPSAFIPQTHVL